MATKLTKTEKRILQAAREVAGILDGTITEGFTVHVPEEIDVRAIRKKLAMTRAQFSRRFGFKPDTVKDWELKRRKPEQAARAFLLVIGREPEAVQRALSV